MSNTKPLRQIRIGIFTYHFSDNFGALMQAYGLREWLRAQGAEAEFVNYHPSHVEGGGRFQNPLSKRGLQADVKIAFLYLSALRRKLFVRSEQRDRFYKFQREVLGITGKRLWTLEEVENFLLTPEGRFDLLVCGSDQIWSPSVQFGLDPVYFLDFSKGAQGARRISYAPSFGKGTLDAAYEAEMCGYLQKFDGLSARETSGVEIVRRLSSGREVAWVPDPALLHGDFSALAHAGDAGVSKGHIYCYALRTGNGIREVCELVRREIGGRILSPYNIHRRWSEIGETVYPSPEEWVAHFARANYVVTNSFHGTVLAILFRKPFLTVALPGKRAQLNERSRDLLASLGLSDRFIFDSGSKEIPLRIADEIEWSVVEEKLEEMQSLGRAFLRDQMDKVRA